MFFIFYESDKLAFIFYFFCKYFFFKKKLMFFLYDLFLLISFKFRSIPFLFFILFKKSILNDNYFFCHAFKF